MKPLIALPAAGASSRMRGRDKLTETIDGIPLLRRQTLAALGTDCPVVVTLPPGDTVRRNALSGLPVTVDMVPDAAEGMAASLRRIASHLADAQPLCIILPDVPGIGTPEIIAVLDAFDATSGNWVTRGSDESDTPGTPLVLPHRIARRFSNLRGDAGGRAALANEQILLVPLPGDRATRDLDTPEDWETWRADNGFDS